ncbi:MAG: glutamate--tRNA ligase [Spirochaetes bacterium]|nr:glutamate--tRNA ligase [Spirochaetota bacterium]
MSIRDRYAPSPTGLQHIGGIRTALFNYLFARSKNGQFILRLEDTDRLRFEERYVQNLYDTFNWLGIKWDEGPDTGGRCAPYIQSERLDLYKKHAQDLIDSDGGYYCFCSTERLDKIRQDQESARSEGAEQVSQSGYDRFCRGIPAAEAGKRVAAGEPYVIRLKIPLGETTRFYDHLLGHIEWKNEDVNPDPVLLKSDGFPTYHLANIVDDHLMEVTHVMRAQEWLSSTPMHVIMYGNFGWTPPEFCHLPMVMGQDGKKLSKRHGATSIDEFRNNGYLPEALLNYVAFLGASYEEGRDIYTLKELAERFSLDKLNKAPAIFDYKKLEWYNGQYIRMKTDEELAALCLPFAKAAGLFGTGGEGSGSPSPEQMRVFTAAMPLVKERLSFLNEVPQKIAYLFADPEVPPAEEFIPKKLDLARTVDLLKICLDLVQPLADSPSDEAAENFIKAEAEKREVKLGDLMMPLRVAITGSRVSPPLFGSLRILGVARSAERVNRALQKLEGS